MKRIITVVAIITLIALSSAFFFSCAIFNKGTLDETYGIYGIKDAYYQYDSETYRFGHKYEYFLIIINENNKATVKYKTVDEPNEVTYELEYIPEYTGKDNNVVDDLIFKNFKYERYLPNTEKVLYASKTNVEKLSCNYNKYVQTITYYQIGLIKGHINSIKFKKLYNKRTDKYINRAIKKQRDSQEDRVTGK